MTKLAADCFYLSMRLTEIVKFTCRDSTHLLGGPLVHEWAEWLLAVSKTNIFRPINTVPMNSSLSLTRFKPSTPFMMSSGTRKWSKY